MGTLHVSRALRSDVVASIQATLVDRVVSAAQGGSGREELMNYIDHKRSWMASTVVPPA